MPPREPQALLEDAIAQIADLEAKVASGSLDGLLGNRDLQAIFERRFEVLGEALRRLERADPAIFARITGVPRPEMSVGIGVDRGIQRAAACGVPTCSSATARGATS